MINNNDGKDLDGGEQFQDSIHVVGLDVGGVLSMSFTKLFTSSHSSEDVYVYQVLHFQQ